MLHKSWNERTDKYDVTFDLPSEVDVEGVAVVGDFNDWDPDATPMSRGADGRHEATASFDPGSVARFRYRISEDQWENDWTADDYVDNEFGGQDSLLVVPEAPAAQTTTATSGGAPGTGVVKKKATSKKAAAKKRPAVKKSATKKKAANKKTAAKKNAATKKPPANKKAAAKKKSPEK